MVAGFMEKYVCVCILKINLGEYSIGGSVSGLKENCSVQKVNLLLMYGEFDLNIWMVNVQCVNKLLEV